MPNDASQLDDAGQFSIIDVEDELDLDVDAEPQAEADAELDAAIATTADEYAAEGDETVEDVGDLYGVHVPAAGDPGVDVNRDGESFQDAELGEHVFETLEKKMAENGTMNPEEDVEFEDDSDPQRGHHKTDRRDLPVADKGSGGPGGL